MKKALILFFLSASFSLAAQQKDITDEYARKYPDDPVVYINRKVYNTIKIERGQVKVYMKQDEDMLLLSDKVSSYSDRPIYYSSFSEISGITAKSLVPDGKGFYTTVPVKDQYTSNEISGGEFFDDSKAIHLLYTGLTRGSRTELSYTEKLNEPRFFGRYFFSLGVPTENAEFAVEVPDGVEIEWKLYNITENDLQFTKVKRGKKTIYTWKRTDSPKYKSEDDAPDPAYFAAHIVVFIRQYTVHKKVIKMLDGPAGLYDWYYSLVKNVNLSPDPGLKHIVDSLTAGVSSEQEKVKRIFYWVQDNIKYVAFEDGLGGFVPREAGDICTKRYGDCKDMASLTTDMLRMAGIPAYLTWIGTRDIPYNYTELPSPMVDNHMICTYIADGKYYFLDATGKNTPFGTPTSMIQGKQALIGEGEGKFEIQTVPVVDPEKNLRIDSVYMHLAPNSSVAGTGVMHATGYSKIHLIYAVDGMNDKDRRDFFKDYLRKGSNKFVLDSLDYRNMYDRDKNLDVNYTYTIGGYARENGNEMYINMQLDKSDMNALLDSTERSAPKEIDHESDQVGISVFDIPGGYSVSCVPKDCSYNGKKFSFSITYTQAGNRIICRKELIVKTLMLKKEDFGEWNDFVKQLTSAYNENVTLVKTQVPPPVIKHKKK